MVFSLSRKRLRYPSLPTVVSPFTPRTRRPTAHENDTIPLNWAR